MIGSLSAPIPAGDIIERPPGLITSLVYEYRKGYTLADTITPGRGYWVKAGSAGSLVLSSVPLPLRRIASRPSRGGVDRGARRHDGTPGAPDMTRVAGPARTRGASIAAGGGEPVTTNSLTIFRRFGVSQTCIFHPARHPRRTGPLKCRRRHPGTSPMCVSPRGTSPIIRHRCGHRNREGDTVVLIERPRSAYDGRCANPAKRTTSSGPGFHGVLSGSGETVLARAPAA